MAHNPLLDHCVELLSAVGHVRTRRMFGGFGIYVDEVFIAIIAFDRLYLKVDNTTRPRFEAAGSQPFQWTNKGELTVMNGYWSAPDDAMESADAMRPWARMAMQTALEARAAAPPKQAGGVTKPAATKTARVRKPATTRRSSPAASAAKRPTASARSKR